MDTLDSLIEFITVVEHGSFSSAARQLGVSVSHVSRQIASLESRLNTQLFVRTTRQMVLTEPGHRLFERSQTLVEDLLAAQDSVRATQDILEGDIRISLGGKFAEDRLVPVLARFASEHPGVRLDLDMSARNVDLLAEGFHLAVRMGPLQSSSSLVARRLASVPMVVVCARRLLEGLQPIETPSELPVGLCLRLAGRPWEFIGDGQHVKVEPSGRISSNSGSALLRAAIGGLGIVNLPAYYLGASTENEELVQLFPEWQSAERPTFYLVFPSSRHIPTRIRRLVDYLQEHSSGLEADLTAGLAF